MEIRARHAQERVKHDPTERDRVQKAIARWLDPPLMVASVLLLVLTLVQLTTPLPPSHAAILAGVETAIWVFFAGSFAVELALANDRVRFLRRNWLRAITVVVPFFGFLRILSVLRFGQWAAYLRIFVLSRRTGSPAMEILRRRHLGQLGFMSVLVVGIAAGLEYLVESGSPGANITSIGDAFWWAAGTLTTIGSPDYPVTTGGKIVALLLMFYAVSVFTYFVASLASLLVGHDESEETKKAAQTAPAQLTLTEDEARVVRNILSRLDGKES